ncbi:MAG: GyrI-like domain-containing protein [Bacteroidales bacterium]|nr:GyrI-like domain-containing protein [Bacteroidales bacterium]
MKALKVILIIIGILVAAILVIPLFSPPVAKISSEIEIELTPEQVFSGVASYSNREAWDPWLGMDSTAVATIESRPGFVGSTYEWEGEYIGRGKMEVDSVVINQYIKSSLTFGDMPNPSTVEWNFMEKEGGTHAVWSYSEETAYPFGRLRMMVGKPIMRESFDSGLANLKAYLEANPPEIVYLKEVAIDTFAPVNAMVVEGRTSMEEIGTVMGEFYGLIIAEIQKQGLEVIANPFAIYTEWNEEAGTFVLTAGLPVSSPGKKAGRVTPRFFDEMELVVGKHVGPYENFSDTYNRLEQYIKEHQIETEEMAIEIYLTNPMLEQDPDKYEALIAFPIKK